MHVSLTPLTLHVTRNPPHTPPAPPPLTISPLATVLAAVSAACPGSPSAPYQGWALYHPLPTPPAPTLPDVDYGFLDYDKTLTDCGLGTHAHLVVTNRLVHLPVRLGRDGPVRKIAIDESWSVYEIVDEIAAVVDDIPHAEEYSLVDAHGNWLQGPLPLAPQRAWSSVQAFPDAPDALTLVRKLYFVSARPDSLAAISASAPTSTLRLHYRDALHAVASGSLLVGEKEAIMLAALALQIENGNRPDTDAPDSADDLAPFLPPATLAHYSSKLARKIARKHKSYAATPPPLAMSKYIKLVRSNPNFGWSFWSIRERVAAGHRFRLLPRLLGLSGQGLKVVDAKRTRDLLTLPWTAVLSAAGTDVGSGPCIAVTLSPRLPETHPDILLSPDAPDAPLIFVFDSPAAVHHALGFIHDYLHLTTRSTLAPALVLTTCASLASLTSTSWYPVLRPSASAAPHPPQPHSLLTEQWHSALAPPPLTPYPATSASSPVLASALALAAAAASSTFYSDGMFILPVLDAAAASLAATLDTALPALAPALAAAHSTAGSTIPLDDDTPSGLAVALATASSGAHDHLAATAIAALELAVASSGDTANLLVPEALASAATVLADALAALIASASSFATLVDYAASSDTGTALDGLWVPAGAATGWRVAGATTSFPRSHIAALIGAATTAAAAAAALLADVRLALTRTRDSAAPDAVAIDPNATAALLAPIASFGPHLSAIAAALGTSPLADDLVADLSSGSASLVARASLLSTAAADESFPTLPRTQAAALAVELRAIPDIAAHLHRSLAIVASTLKLRPVYHAVAAKVALATTAISATIRSIPPARAAEEVRLGHELADALATFDASLAALEPSPHTLLTTLASAASAAASDIAALIAELPAIDDIPTLATVTATAGTRLARLGALLRNTITVLDANGSLLPLLGSLLPSLVATVSRCSAFRSRLTPTTDLADAAADAADLLAHARLTADRARSEANLASATSALLDGLSHALVAAAAFVVDPADTDSDTPDDIVLTLGRSIASARADAATLTLTPRSLAALDALIRTSSAFVSSASAFIASRATHPSPALTSLSDSLAPIDSLAASLDAASMSAKLALHLHELTILAGIVDDSFPTPGYTSGSEDSDADDESPAATEPPSPSSAQAAALVSDIDALLDQLDLNMRIAAVDAASSLVTSASVTATIAHSASLPDVVASYSAASHALRDSLAALAVESDAHLALAHPSARKAHNAALVAAVRLLLADARTVVDTSVVLWPKIYTPPAIDRLRATVAAALDTLAAPVACIRTLVQTPDATPSPSITAELTAAMRSAAAAVDVLPTGAPGVGMLRLVASRLRDRAATLTLAAGPSADPIGLDSTADALEAAVSDLLAGDSTAAARYARSLHGPALRPPPDDAHGVGASFAHLESALRFAARVAVSVTADPPSSLNDVETGAHMVSRILDAFIATVLALPRTLQVGADAALLRAPTHHLLDALAAEFDSLADAALRASLADFRGDADIFDPFFAALDTLVATVHGESGETADRVSRVVAVASGARDIVLAARSSLPPSPDNSPPHPLCAALAAATHEVDARLASMDTVVVFELERGSATGAWPGLDASVVALGTQAANELVSWAEAAVAATAALGSGHDGPAPTPHAPASPASPPLSARTPLLAAIDAEFKAVMFALTRLKAVGDASVVAARQIRDGYTKLVLAIRDLLVAVKSRVVDADAAHPLPTHTIWVVDTADDVRDLRKAGSGLKAAAMAVIKHCDEALTAASSPAAVRDVVTAKPFRRAFKKCVAALLGLKATAERIRGVEHAPDTHSAATGGATGPSAVLRSTLKPLSDADIAERVAAAGPAWLLDVPTPQLEAAVAALNGARLAAVAVDAAETVVDALAALTGLVEPTPDRPPSGTNVARGLARARHKLAVVAGLTAAVQPTARAAASLLVLAERALESGRALGDDDTRVAKEARAGAVAEFVALTSGACDGLGALATDAGVAAVRAGLVAIDNVLSGRASPVWSSEAQRAAVAREAVSAVRDGIVPVLGGVLRQDGSEQACLVRSREVFGQLARVFDEGQMALLDAAAWRRALVDSVREYVGVDAHVDLVPGFGYSDYVKRCKQRVVDAVRAAQGVVDAARKESGLIGVRSRQLVEVTQSVLECVAGCVANTPASHAAVRDGLSKAGKTLAWNTGELIAGSLSLVEGRDGASAAVVSCSQRLSSAVELLLAELRDGAVDAQMQKGAVERMRALGATLEQARLVLQTPGASVAATHTVDAGALEDALHALVDDHAVDGLGGAVGEAAVARAVEAAADALAAVVADAVAFAHSGEADAGSAVCKLAASMCEAFAAAAADAGAHCGAGQASGEAEALIGAAAGRARALIRAVRAGADGAARMVDEVAAIGARVSAAVDVLAELMGCAESDGAAEADVDVGAVVGALEGLAEAVGKVWMLERGSGAAVLSAALLVASRVDAVVAAMEAVGGGGGERWVELAGSVWHAASEAGAAIEGVLESGVVGAKAAWEAAVESVQVARGVTGRRGRVVGLVGAVESSAAALRAPTAGGGVVRGGLVAAVGDAVEMVVKIEFLAVGEAEDVDESVVDAIVEAGSAVGVALAELVLAAVTFDGSEDGRRAAMTAAVQRVSGAVVSLIGANDGVVAGCGGKDSKIQKGLRKAMRRVGKACHALGAAVR